MLEFMFVFSMLTLFVLVNVVFLFLINSFLLREISLKILSIIAIMTLILAGNIILALKHVLMPGGS
jgi:hypothetical protein